MKMGALKKCENKSLEKPKQHTQKILDKGRPQKILINFYSIPSASRSNSLVWQLVLVQVSL